MINVRHCLMIVSMFVCCHTLTVQSATVVMQENFEQQDALNAFTINQGYTITKLSLASPGNGSAQSLLVDKPDACGYIQLQRNIEAQGGAWYQLSLDIKTIQKRAYSTFDIMVIEFADGKRVAKHKFAYNDGIVRVTSFGGRYKTPQTMNQWRETRHIFKTSATTTKLEVKITISKDRQKIELDNLVLKHFGKIAPPSNNKVIFKKQFAQSDLVLDLDRLLPGCSYMVTASFTSKQASDSTVTTTGNTGLQTVWINDRGEKSSPVKIVQTSTLQVGAKSYLLTVPWDAVNVMLEFPADANQSRVWTAVKISLVSLGESPRDAAYLNYLKNSANPRPDNFIDLNGFALQALKRRLAKRTTATAKVVNKQGGMCFSIDGKLIPPFVATHKRMRYDLEVYDNLVKNGIKLLVARTAYGGPATHGDWTGPGKYDFSDLDKQVYSVLLHNPGVYLILSIDSIYPPDWWSEAHPEELTQDQDGNYCWAQGTGLYKRRFGTMEELTQYRDKKVRLSGREKTMGSTWKGHFVPSTASFKAREICNDYLTAFRRHVENSDYGKIVVGYRVLAGFDIQWGWIKESFGYKKEGPHYIDFSKPMLVRFKKFAQHKYKTIAALRKAWNDKKITFATITLPGVERRNIDQFKSSNGYFFKPSLDKKFIDYRECENMTVGETVNSYMTTIKQAAKKDVFTMAYYSDISESCTGRAGRQRGIDVVMSSKALDCGGGPSYEGRDIGLSNKSNTMLNSFSLHNKIAFTEFDHRVYPVIKGKYCNNIIFDSPRKSISLIRREFMKQMCYGGGIWTLDMGMGWYHDPLIARIFGDTNRVFQAILKNDRNPIGKFALFAGDAGKNIQADSRRGSIPKILLSAAKVNLPHSGFPINQYQLRDLAQVAHKYKIFYFPFAYALTDKERAKINALKKDGNLLIFGYGAGYVSSHSANLKNVEAITGFKLAVSDNRLNFTVKFNQPALHPIAQYASGYMGSGGDLTFEKGLPRIYVKDAKAIPLAYFVAKDNQQRVGIAYKNHGNWQSIYIGTVGLIMPELFRGIAAFAGQHIYSEAGDVLYLNKSLLAIHASTSGKKIIMLPKPAFVTSLFDNVELGYVNKIVRDMRVGDNAIYSIKR